MNFSEQPPSKQWATLKYRGEKLAEVWFKPEGEPFGLTFRIPQKSFQTAGMAQQLTAENLLKAVAIAADEVESLRFDDVAHSGLNGADAELGCSLSPPPPEAAHLDMHVRLKPPPQAFAPDERGGEEDNESRDESAEPESVAATWEDLEARWKAILALEATVDTMRISMEVLLSEMEGALKKTLTTEEKIHARRADVAQWNKAKSRVHHSLPRMREFVHRATWAIGAPERKQLEEIYKNHIQPRIPFPEMNKVLAQLENLQKDRQILSAHGVTVFHECKSIAAAVQEALRTLQHGAAVNAHKKKGGAAGKGGKFFKNIRRWSGAE